MREQLCCEGAPVLCGCSPVLCGSTCAVREHLSCAGANRAAKLSALCQSCLHSHHPVPLQHSGTVSMQSFAFRLTQCLILSLELPGVCSRWLARDWPLPTLMCPGHQVVSERPGSQGQAWPPGASEGSLNFLFSVKFSNGMRRASCFPRMASWVGVPAAQLLIWLPADGLGK